jgi:hypothetical protein
MKLAPATFLGCLVLAGAASGAEDFFDRLRDALTATSPSGTTSARLSGTLDLEYYALPYPAPGLVYTRERHLFNPRLTVFLDAQLGPRVYGFVQARADRGFDPSDGDLRARLDEYALRYTPGRDGSVSVQAGKFATVVGSWVLRHGSWENPFITAPLVYENLTGIWDSVAAHSSGVLLGWAHALPNGPNTDTYADKHLRTPIIWGPAYASGLAILGETGAFNFAAEVKNAGLSSRPESWTFDDATWRHPAVSARLGYRPNMMWNLGFSGSTGPYLRPSAAPTLIPGYGLGDYRETVFGQDASFAWHYWQVWLEAFEARFEIPRVGSARTVSWYTEAKYKFTPQFFGAVRWNQQVYGDITHLGGRVPWGRDTWRIDLAPSYRFSPNLQLKLQYSLQHEDLAPRNHIQLFAAQLTVRY